MINRQGLLAFSVALMLAGLFISRALLSAGIIVYLLAAFDYRKPQNQIKQFLTNPVYWGMSLLFFIPVISGLWSTDVQKWLDVCRIKLPLFVLPFAVASNIKPALKNWVLLTVMLIIFITGGTVYSMWHYLLDAEAVHASYLQAKTLLTPLENDHVRFSWLVSAGILLIAMLVNLQKRLPAVIKVAWLLLAAWLVIYLHILAARTGLLAFYSMCIAGIFYFILKYRKLQGILWGLVLLIMPVIAIFTIPTFQKRFQYLNYDLSQYKQVTYMPGSNDGMRLISMYAGWQLMNRNPLMGTGFGDIENEVKAWYDSKYPEMLEADKILPSSEWLMYGAGAGYTGTLFFTGIMLLPFFIKKYRLQWPWLLINLAALLSFIFDIGLEVQFGIFVYAFTILWVHTGLGYKINNGSQ